jgi:hypothetical protein
MKHELQFVFVSRNDQEENYTITGIPKRGEHDPKQDIQEICKASYLSVNGIGFACDSCEFSQYGETIVVEQETDGGSANIILPDN